MIPVQTAGAPVQAKFNHPNGTSLRLQAFVVVRAADGRVAAVRTQDNPDVWFLPGETLLLNEDPAEAAKRVLRSWFTTPLDAPELVDVFSYPATGGEDNRWYLLFMYQLQLSPGALLEATPDTLELQFITPGENAPGPWGADHKSVWEMIP
ncbi:MAG TPA: NUDIX domain-containing protein [Candidatus Thermoplasmatota archaeon]|nr:NUDIX domain-containing protein [Candidatus Thermoplasmatota archaeon]